MEIKLYDRFRAAWNAFRSRDPTNRNTYGIGPEDGTRQDRTRIRYTTEKSIVNAIYTRVAVDCSEIDIRHVRVDENDQYVELIESGLNNCLSLEANIDQTNRDLVQDIVMSMFDEGVVALVPVDTSSNPYTGSFDVLTLRTGKILGWFPKHVRLDVYNDISGRREEITLPKTSVGIVPNPFYSIMNIPNSIPKRIIHKLNLLDAIDEQSGSGKLDIIMQLPFVVKTDARKQEAEKRRQDIENQLSGSKYGIAWIDAIEKITQLNRPSENNIMIQVEFLTRLLYSQLGITEEILAGTADEKTLLNYYNQAINPVMSAITTEIKRKFLTKTARTQRQSIKHFRDPFKNVTAENLAKLSDSLTRNEIASSNEMRAVIGWKPRPEASANELRNKNLNQNQAPAPENNEDKETR